MSGAEDLVSQIRFGRKMGDFDGVAMMVGAPHGPFGRGHLGATTDNIAAQEGVTRLERDEFAVESHRHAAASSGGVRFANQSVDRK